MSSARFTVTGIRVESGVRKPATIEFSKGLNVVAGASETGKTFIFETIDYLLGAKRSPSPNPASRGYNRAVLGVRDSNGDDYALLRSFESDDVFLYQSDMASPFTGPPDRHLAAIHRKGVQDTLSHFLLSRCGLTGHSLRRNQQGDKSALTFRHVAHLTLIGEERIISKSSPALSGQYVSTTIEKALFAFFLTGADDNDLVVRIPPKDQRISLVAEEAIIMGLISEKQDALHSLTSNEHDLANQERAVSEAIEYSTSFSSSLQEEIHALETQRQQKWNDLQKVKSRILYLNEQLARFDLLLSFYGSDRARLEAMLEAGMTFEQMPQGVCAACGNPTGEDPNTTVAESTLAQFRVASSEEIRKIGLLSADLINVISESRHELQSLIGDESRFSSVLREIDDKLRNTLQPQSVENRSKLSELLNVKLRIARALDIQKEIVNLRSRISSIALENVQLKRKRSRSVSKVGTAAAFRFCEELANTLKAWRFPLRGSVSFDPEQFDIVIGEQNRGSMGKGHRALTHAAFTVGLMRYCRAQGIAHPGVVVLDTPLNPYRGPDEEDGGRINIDIQEAFFEDLARHANDDQVIVLENTEPPTQLLGLMNYQHFSKNPKIGRYGFFPVHSA